MIYRKLIAITLFACASPFTSAGEVSVTLGHDARGTSGPNAVNVVLSNQTAGTIYVVGYNSVLELPEGRTTGNWLHVTDAFGREVPYRGRYVVSGPLAVDSFIRVEPGASIERTVDVAGEYDLPPAGTVTVSTTIATYDADPARIAAGLPEAALARLVKSNEITFPVVNVHARATKDIARERAPAGGVMRGRRGGFA